MKQSHKTLLLWVLLIMMFLAIWQFLSPAQSPATQVAFSDFMANVESGKVEQVTIAGHEIAGIYRSDKERFRTYAPSQYDGLARQLIERGLRSYWGYNTIGFFAPMSRYLATNSINEFKTMVKTLHSAGLEVWRCRRTGARWQWQAAIRTSTSTTPRLPHHASSRRGWRTMGLAPRPACNLLPMTTSC